MELDLRHQEALRPYEYGNEVMNVYVAGAMTGPMTLNYR